MVASRAREIAELTVSARPLSNGPCPFSKNRKKPVNHFAGSRV